MIFGPKHSILELPALPRERGALQQIIMEARHQRKIGKLKRWAALNCVAWGMYILLVWRPAQGMPKGPQPAPSAIFLPLIQR